MKFIHIAKPNFDGHELQYITDCIKTGWVSSAGKYVVRFEKQFAKFCGTQYAVATSSGTAALHLALQAIGTAPGDEVILPTLTFVAPANTIAYCGAKPVFVDSDFQSWDIDHRHIPSAITKRTKAILPVHLYGQPAEMREIMRIAKRHRLYVIEDAAEAHGAQYQGRMVGSIGDIGCFSFYGNKIITTGEGGMLVTNHKRFYQKAVMLRHHGMHYNKKYWHPCIGYNYRMTNLQAAIGVAQLQRSKMFMRKKIQIAKLYNYHLRNIQGIGLPTEVPGTKHAYWMYTILVQQEYPLAKETLRAVLRKSGIDSRPVFYPIHTMPPYKTYKRLPVAEKLSKEGLTLPSGFDLQERDIRKIAAIIKRNGLRRQNQ